MIACYLASARAEERILLSGPRGTNTPAWQKRTWRMIPFIYYSSHHSTLELLNP